VTESLAGASAVTVVGPCPGGLLESLGAAGLKTYTVSAGSAWDASAAVSTRSGPLSFLAQVSEDSLESVLVCELAFWLSPASLVGLARRSYLTLAAGGKLLLTVHAFAAGSPAPAWCSPPVLERALELAGFQRIAVSELDSGESQGSPGFIVAGHKV
jgi:hypothetical protein